MEVTNLTEGLQSQDCRVYWGSHGCMLPRGHKGPHICTCHDDPPEPGVRNAGRPPYYGPTTTFYGEDACNVEQANP
jgi:hypothetical protein